MTRSRSSGGGRVLLAVSALTSAVALAGTGTGSAAAATATAAGTAVKVHGQGSAVVRPNSTMLTCADHGTIAEDLHWTSWTATGATATGQIVTSGCATRYADTGADRTSAQFTLAKPVDEAGRVLFTALTVRVSGADHGGYQTTATFDESPDSAAPGNVPGTATSAIASSAASGQLGYAAIEGYWIDAGGPSDLASTAAAITGAESSFEPGIIQPGEPYATTGWSLWQITPGNSSPSEYGSDYQLLDPWNSRESAL